MAGGMQVVVAGRGGASRTERRGGGGKGGEGLQEKEEETFVSFSRSPNRSSLECGFRPSTGAFAFGGSR